MSTIQLGELTARDQGREVTMTGGHAKITGTLIAFHVESDWIDVTEFGGDPDNPQRIHGARSMSIRIGEWETSGLPLDTVVEVER